MNHHHPPDHDRLLEPGKEERITPDSHRGRGPKHRPVNTLQAADQAADDGARRTAHASDIALGWVVMFFALHVYWYLGGSFATPGKLIRPDSASLRWADYAIDVYFLAGGIIFGLFAVRYRAQRRRV